MTSTPLGLGPGAIFETHVDTTDLTRAIEFYRDRLGLTLAYHLEARSVAFFWIGQAGNAMLGVWEVEPGAWRRSHFAFTIAESEIEASIERLNAAGVATVDFWGEPTIDPSVHAWMPACGVFFRDPDGNSLELVAMLPGEGRPDLGVVSLSEWRRRAQEAASVR